MPSEPHERHTTRLTTNPDAWAALPDVTRDTQHRIYVVCTDRGRHPMTSITDCLLTQTADGRNWLTMGWESAGWEGTKRPSWLPPQSSAGEGTGRSRTSGQFTCPRCKRDVRILVERHLQGMVR